MTDSEPIWDCTLHLPCGFPFTYQVKNGEKPDEALLERVRQQHEGHQPGECKRRD